MLRRHGGNYPALRGTFVDLKGKGLKTWTVRFRNWRKRLWLSPRSTGTQPGSTKNFPRPSKAAREVGRILKYIECDVPTSPDFRKYA
jgi:hypothetical protein